jgi:hypothetical protein
MLFKQMLFICIMLLFVFSSLFCSENNSKSQPYTEKRDAMSIDEVLAQKKEALLALPGVVGTAQSLCEGQPCLKVYVVQPTPELIDQIGELLKGHLFQIQVSGKFKTKNTSG